MFTFTTFIPKKQAEKVVDPERKSERAIISITTPEDDQCSPASLHEDSWRGILRLQFHDVDPSAEAKKRQRVLFNEQHAQEIFLFLKEQEAFGGALICHCEAGISRSAAVAKFIAQIYSLDYPESYSLYNKHVFTTLLRVYYQCLYGTGPVPINQLPALT
jgi:predicted protein tyrosine phosphatase